MFRLALVLAALIVPPQEATETEKRNFVEKNLDKAIEKGLRALRELQQTSGSFESFHNSYFTHGCTALSLYTLLALGGTLNDPAAAKALDWLLSSPIELTSRANTYEVSLVAIALSYCVPHLPKGVERDRTTFVLQRTADWLVKAQEPGGGWGYRQKSNGWHDHSNSQFAVLGLRAAANAGADVKKEVWERELTHYKTSQQADGGWGYRACYSSRGTSTSTMTAAGVMGLAIALGSAKAAAPEQLSTDVAIKKGLEAMKVNWERGLSYELKPLGGVGYLLYSVERACMLTGRRLLGNIDWYLEGSWVLLRLQKPDGIFAAEGRDSTASHCFALLFLKRAFVPVETPSRPRPRPPSESDPNADKPREME